jgi:hypothetical protein
MSKTMKQIKISEYLKYAFSESERTENAKNLARRTQALDEIERKKKQLTADLKAEQETAAAEVQKLARWVNDEYDFRMIECELKLNSPKAGMKEIIRLDTGEIVTEKKMSADEMQETLPFADATEG